MRCFFSASCLVLIILLILLQPLAKLNQCLASVNSLPDLSSEFVIGDGTIDVKVEFEAPSFIKVDGYDFVEIPNCSYMRKVGEPTLPMKGVLVLLPPGMDVEGLEVSAVESEKLQGEFYIYPGQPPVNQYVSYSFAEPDPKVYSSDSLYPGKFYEFAGVETLRGYRLASIRIFPIQYRPLSRELLFHKLFDIMVHLVGTAIASEALNRNAAGISRPILEIDEWVRRNVANPELIKDYENAFPRAQAVWAEYLIISREMFRDSLTPLLDRKLWIGMEALMVSVEDIVGGGDPPFPYPGRDVPEKIRNCIIDFYQNHGTRWVLLAGDVDPVDQELNTDWEVPIRYVYNPDYPPYGIYTPTDYYYAGLDGDWDSDSDSEFGESWYYSIDDEVDWFPDVFVGRITATTVQEMQSQVNKILNFEGFNVNNMLLLGAISDPDTDEKYLKETLREWYVPPTVSTLGLYESDGTLNEANVIASINTYEPELVNSASHGSYDGLWLYYDGTYASAITPISLTNKPHLWYASACLAGGYDWDGGDCFGEALMKNSDGGALAFVGATRVTWYYVGYPEHYWGLNGAQDYLFWWEFLEWNDHNPGSALYGSKLMYIFGWCYDLQDEAERKNLFAYMLLGDPALYSPEKHVAMLNFDDYKNRMGSLTPMEPTTTFYFPHFHQDSNWQTYIALVNPNVQPTATVTLTAFDKNGVELRSTTVYLDPLCKVGGLVKDLFGGLTGTGWIEVESDMPIIGLLNFDDYVNRMGSMSGVTPATTIYFPHFHQDSVWQTYIAVVNPNSTDSATVTFTAYRNDGTPTGAPAVWYIGPRVKVGGLVHQIIPSATGTGWITVESDLPIVGMLNFDDYKNRMGSMEACSSSYTLYFPHFHQDSKWQTYVAFANPSASETAYADITAYRGDGTIAGTRELTLAPHSKYGALVNSLVTGLTGTGWLEVVSSIPIVGMENFDDYQNRMGSLSASIPQQTVFFPHFHRDSSWQTYVSIVNLGPAATTVIDYWRSDGYWIGWTCTTLGNRCKTGTFTATGTGWLRC